MNTLPDNPTRPRRGDIHPETGMVFWQAWRKAYGKNRIHDLWLPREVYEARMARLLATKQVYYRQNKARLREAKKAWEDRNRERVRERHRAWSQHPDNRARCNAASLAWKKKNPDAFRLAAQRRRRFKRRTDFLHRLKLLCRSRVAYAIKWIGGKKNNRTMEIVGCSPEFLREFLREKFTDGMTFDNHGLWEIDHKIPLASAKTEQDLLALCHFTNLQPLWRTDNQKKGAKICSQ